MKRLLLLFPLCVLLVVTLCLPVSAESAATKVDLQCTVTSEGDCIVTATVNLRLEAALDQLTYPVPLNAKKYHRKRFQRECQPIRFRPSGGFEPHQQGLCG